MNKYFDKKNLKILVFIFTTIGGLLFFLIFYPKVFPIIPLEIKQDKKELLSIAEKFLATMGYKLEGYDKFIIFSVDPNADYYLQKKFTFTKIKDLLKSIPLVYYWEARWFKFSSREEYKVFLDPSGKIYGFLHQIPEDVAKENLNEQEALSKVLHFLANQGIDISKYHLVSSSYKQQISQRIDHTFLYEKKIFVESSPITLQLEVTVAGNEISKFKQNLKVPESFIKEVERKNLYGEFLSLISFTISVCLFILSLITVIIGAKSGNLQWRFAIVSALFVAIVIAGEEINNLPFMMAFYSPVIEKEIFFVMSIGNTLISAIVLCIIIFLAGSAGDLLYKRNFNALSSPSIMFTKNWLFMKDFDYSVLRGYGLAFMWLGFLTFFYMIGTKYFDIYFPLETSYSETLSAFFPFFTSFAIGILGGFHEEFVFRLFLISALKRYVPTFIAILFPAMLWGFAHSYYPIYPVYVRGIELTFLGIILGYSCIKYGIITPIIVHYVINVILTSLPLIKSSNIYLIITSFMVIGLPLLLLFTKYLLLIKGRNIWLCRNPQQSEFKNPAA